MKTLYQETITASFPRQVKERNPFNARNIIGLVAAAILLTAALPRDAAAGVILTQRDSKVEVGGAINNEYGESDFYGFSIETHSLTADVFDFVSGHADVTGHHQDGSAAQVSTLYFDTGNFVKAAGSGSSDSHRTDAESPAGGGYGLADSFFDVFFTVDIPTVYNITASLSADGPAGFGYAKLELSDVTGGPIHSWEVTGGDATLGINVDGILPIGDYQLHMQAHSVPSDPVNSAMFDAVLTIPEPATLSLLALGGLAMLRRRK